MALAKVTCTSFLRQLLAEVTFAINLHGGMV